MALQTVEAGTSVATRQVFELPLGTSLEWLRQSWSKRAPGGVVLQMRQDGRDVDNIDFVVHHLGHPEKAHRPSVHDEGQQRQQVFDFLALKKAPEMEHRNPDGLQPAAIRLSRSLPVQRIAWSRYSIPERRISSTASATAEISSSAKSTERNSGTIPDKPRREIRRTSFPTVTCIEVANCTKAFVISSTDR